MKLIAYAPFGRRPALRVELAGARTIRGSATRKALLTARYVLAEDLDFLYATGISRRILVLRWTR